MNDVSMTYRATCRKCGHVTMLVVDEPGHGRAVAKALAKAVRAGDIVERIETSWVRMNVWEFCTCAGEPETKQLALPGLEG